MPSKTPKQLIAGLDIGSTAVRMAVGQIVPRGDDGDGYELQILGASEVRSEGVSKGVVASIEDVVSSVSACFEKTERIVGSPIDSVWLGISGIHILAQHSKGVVAVSKADNEISEDDVTRALEAARSISTPLNYEVLHVLPKTFTVDGQSGIKDPVGMTGMRIEVDTQIILGASSQIKNLTKAVYRSGLEIDDLVLSILATSEAAVTSRQKDLGVAVVDIGGATTGLAVFEEGDIVHTAILPVGSERITNDLAIGLRTSIETAEKVKIKFGDSVPDNVSRKDEIDLYEMGAAEHEVIKRRYASEIIEARVEEILFKIDQELRKIDRSGLLPAGIVFVGAGAKMPGLIDMAKKHLRLPAVLGYPLEVASVTDKVNDLGFVTAIGLVKWGSMMIGRSGMVVNRPNPVKSLSKWIKSILP